jgi:hypothetical protein
VTPGLERARQLVEEGHTLLPAADPDSDEQGFTVVHMEDGKESSEIVLLSRDELQKLRDEFDNRETP